MHWAFNMNLWDGKNFIIIAILAEFLRSRNIGFRRLDFGIFIFLWIETLCSVFTLNSSHTHTSSHILHIYRESKIRYKLKLNNIDSVQYLRTERLFSSISILLKQIIDQVDLGLNYSVLRTKTVVFLEMVDWAKELRILKYCLATQILLNGSKVLKIDLM